MVTRKMFTNTNKWTKDAWFRKLKPELKLFWLYAYDTCDHAGFWKVDFELAEVCIGAKLDESEILEVFGEKIRILEEDLWWLREYCILQSKNILKPNTKNSAHKSSVELMIKHGVYSAYIDLFFETYPGLGRANDSLKNKEQLKLPVKNENKSKSEIPLEEENTSMSQEEIESEVMPWEQNPNKLGTIDESAFPESERSTSKENHSEKLFNNSEIDEAKKRAFQKARDEH